MIVIVRNGRVFIRVERLAGALLAHGSTSIGFDYGARVDAAVKGKFGARARLSRAVGWQMRGSIAGSSRHGSPCAG